MKSLLILQKIQQIELEIIPFVCECKDRITSIAKKIFEALSFPLRFVGSKTWSLPGIICRLPIAIWKKVFGNVDNSFSEELFGKNSTFQPEKVLTPEETKKFLFPACAWAYLHTHKLEWIEPLHLKIISPKKFDLAKDPSLDSTDDTYFDRETGLQISVVEKENDVFISFGTVPYGDVEMPKPLFPNSLFRHFQFIGHKLNIIGFKPYVYERADRFVTYLLKDEYFKNKKITLGGLCSGGSIAQYVAIKNGLSAIGFNTLPLGVGLQQTLGTKALEKAKNQMTHLIIEKDLLNEFYGLDKMNRLLNFIGMRTPGNFGTCYRIPSAYQSQMDTHSYFIGSMMQHLGYNKRAKPCDLDEKFIQELN